MGHSTASTITLKQRWLNVGPMTRTVDAYVESPFPSKIHSGIQHWNDVLKLPLLSQPSLSDVRGLHPMLDRCRRRWANINPAFGESVVFAC